ncbi:MAG: Gx transporter family protein [Acutalibacteraceae bacterium]|nr:Gx transporter family protein [Acutalibacteraceae bacterium]
MSIKPKFIAFAGVSIALAMVLAYIEVIIPPLFPAIPGIKMGLPNIVIVFLLYRRGPTFAAIVSLLRILLVSMLFGNAMALMYSLAGGILSLLVMILLRKLNFLSAVGVSVAGGVTHNVGQILMAMLLLNTSELGYYLVILTVTGTISGILIGLCGAALIKRVPKNII